MAQELIFLPQKELCSLSQTESVTKTQENPTGWSLDFSHFTYLVLQEIHSEKNEKK